jgi:colanic acid/amylovoran biosynthesis glycosyltransferase
MVAVSTSGRKLFTLFQTMPKEVPKGLSRLTSNFRKEVMDRNVAIWKSLWLASSETFVRHQSDAHSTWVPHRVGLSRIPSTLETSDVSIVFPESFLGRLRKKLFTLTRWDPAVERFFRDGNFRLIHAHFGVDATLIVPIARKLKIPLVVTVHGYDVTSAPRGGRLWERIYSRRVKGMFSYSSEIFAVSNFISQKSIDLGARPEKVSIHYIGIPVTAVDTRSDGDPKYDLIFIGRFVEKKGIKDLLLAVSLIQLRSDLRPKLVLVGSGEDGNGIRKMAESLSIDAEFLGFLPPHEVREALAASRIFVGPSKTASTGDSEGLGMVFLEAALAGLPVVSYKHGGVTDAVVDGVTGLLAIEGDVHELSRAIETLLNSPDLAREMGSRGRIRVMEDFDVIRQTQRLELLFDKHLPGSKDALAPITG